MNPVCFWAGGGVQTFDLFAPKEYCRAAFQHPLQTSLLWWRNFFTKITPFCTSLATELQLFFAFIILKCVSAGYGMVLYVDFAFASLDMKFWYRIGSNSVICSNHMTAIRSTQVSVLRVISNNCSSRVSMTPKQTRTWSLCWYHNLRTTRSPE